jgi:hypothetical protein
MLPQQLCWRVKKFEALLGAALTGLQQLCSSKARERGGRRPGAIAALRHQIARRGRINAG